MCTLVAATVLESLQWTALPSTGQCPWGPDCLILSTTLSGSLALRGHSYPCFHGHRLPQGLDTMRVSRAAVSLTQSRLMGSSRTERLWNRKSTNTEIASWGRSPSSPVCQLQALRFLSVVSRPTHKGSGKAGFPVQNACPLKAAKEQGTPVGYTLVCFALGCSHLSLDFRLSPPGRYGPGGLFYLT